ncbi:hypothetical protein HYY75_12330, partial [bacterium]|nr:hypothetical protein [bacterium]
MTSGEPQNPSKIPQDRWDEPRIVVFLIGLCLILEAGLIYYQAGPSQIAISAITGVSGLTLLLFAWFVPLEDEEDLSEAPNLEPSTTPEIAAPPSVEIQKQEEPVQEAKAETSTSIEAPPPSVQSKPEVLQETKEPEILPPQPKDLSSGPEKVVESKEIPSPTPQILAP